MRKPDEKTATVLLEEATHLLRSAPAGLYLMLYSGTAAFVLGFLYFWTDMSAGAQASRTASGAALVMALLFVWMKTAQALFSNRLREHLLGLEPRRLGLRHILRVVTLQAAWQPTGFLVLPIAMLIALPFGWAYAFYRNLLFFGTGEEAGFKPPLKASWRQASISPGQNHMLLGILMLLWLLVFVNSMVALVLAPYLVKTLLGIESVFTRSGFSIFNTTLLAAAWGLSYLVMEPLVNAAFTLRCFYGESISTGEDLRAELASHASASRGRARGAVYALAVLCALLAAAPAASETPAPPDMRQPQHLRGGDPINTVELDRAIDDVLTKRQYQWRMPKVDAPEPAPQNSEPGILDEFFASVGKTLKGWARSTARAIRAFFRWLSDILPKFSPAAPMESLDDGFAISPDVLVLALISVISVLGGVIAYRLSRQRRSTLAQEAIPVSSSAARPDIEDERILADALLCSEWLRMASELMAAGEERLALRAMYLACLAQLAGAGLLGIAAYKSNKDYLAELASREHALPGLAELFSENVLAFERVWYGRHSTSAEMLDAFKNNNQRIFGIAESAS